jgi:PST family polysaccharide transporter
MLKYAMNTYGRFTVNYFARNTDNLLVGWAFGAHALGFYKKAYDLFALSTTQLVASTSVVAVSALSRVTEDRSQYRRFLLGAMTVMAFLGMDLILLLLGPAWAPAGQIFTFFAPGIGMMILYNTHGWIHLSIGKADRWFLWGIVEWIVTILLLLVGLQWGPQGIAVAWCISFWILTIPAMWYAGRPIGFGAGEVISVVWRYILASLLAGLVCWFFFSRQAWLSGASGAGGAALRIVVVSISFTLLYLLTIVLLYSSLSPLKRMSDLLREMVSARGVVGLSAAETLPGVGEHEQIPTLAK